MEQGERSLQMLVQIVQVLTLLFDLLPQGLDPVR